MNYTRKIICFIVLLAINANVSAQNQLILAKINRTESGIKISEPLNIGNNKGYDSQPFFYEMSRSVLFSTKADSIQTDIYKYDMNTNKKIAITKNTENEFSPLLTFNKQNISCVKGKEQRLAIYDLDGKNEDTLFTHPDSIGYYNWIADNKIVAVVLTNPQTLQIINTKTKETTIVADKIGRTIAPFLDGFMYVKENYKDKGVNYIVYVDKNMRQSPMAPLKKGKEDFCYMNDTLFTVENDTLKYTDVKSERNWVFGADLRQLGMFGVSRLAANDRGDRMVFVAKEFIAPITQKIFEVPKATPVKKRSVKKS
jgi:hypothetical protein